MRELKHKIKPYIEAELRGALAARKKGLKEVEFSYLENAHVLGQQSTYWHVKVHGLMLLWAVRERDYHELVGQVLRIVGAATKTAIGLVPKGNTGGSDISPFQTMPIKPELQKIIEQAKAK